MGTSDSWHVNMSRVEEVIISVWAERYNWLIPQAVVLLPDLLLKSGNEQKGSSGFGLNNILKTLPKPLFVLYVIWWGGLFFAIYNLLFFSMGS